MTFHWVLNPLQIVSFKCSGPAMLPWRARSNMDAFRFGKSGQTLRSGARKTYPTRDCDCIGTTTGVARSMRRRRR